MVKQQILGEEDGEHSKDQTPLKYDFEVKQDLKKENQTTDYSFFGLKNKTIFFNILFPLNL